MKKLLFILLAFNFNVFSQTNPITLISPNTYTINQGDSGWVTVSKWNQPNMTDSVYLFLKPTFGGSITYLSSILWKGTYNDINNLPIYTPNGIDVYRKLIFKIPANQTTGNNWYNLGNDYSHWNSASGDIGVVVNSITGIEDYNSKEDLISTEYFNLLGQPISKPDGITVEVKTYKGGFREVRKIIY